MPDKTKSSLNDRLRKAGIRNRNRKQRAKNNCVPQILEKKYNDQ
jgi:hypothetical protein